MIEQMKYLADRVGPDFLLDALGATALVVILFVALHVPGVT